MQNIKFILSQKNYLTLFIALFIFFAITLIFAWNLIIYTNFFVREDLWTAFNLAAIFITAILSALNFTLSIYHLKRLRKTFGFFSIIPIFFTTACSGCVPIILSFWSATAGIWFAYFSGLRFYLIILSIAILSASLWKLLGANNGCFTDKH